MYIYSVNHFKCTAHKYNSTDWLVSEMFSKKRETTKQPNKQFRYYSIYTSAALVTTQVKSLSPWPWEVCFCAASLHPSCPWVDRWGVGMDKAGGACRSQWRHVSHTEDAIQVKRRRSQELCTHWTPLECKVSGVWTRGFGSMEAWR